MPPFPSPADPLLDDIQVRTQRLGCLPLVKRFLDQLQVRTLVDKSCPSGQHVLSHGQCVEALVMSMFLGTHALSRVGERLENYDLAGIFGAPITPDQLHDMRLAETLDALHVTGHTIHGDLVAQAIRTFKLDTRTLNLDGTKILLYGEYNCLEDYLEHAETVVFPERGWNPAGRKDLKQLQSFLVVNKDHFPLMYSWADGAAGETPEYLKLMRRLNTIGADVQESVLVADCKVCAYDTLLEAVNQNWRLVTLMPETFSARKALIAQVSKEEELPLLLKTPDGEEYRGMSILMPRLVDPTTGEEWKTRSLLWRYLVVHSSNLAKQVRERRVREVEEERTTLGRKAGKLEREVYACKADANKIGDAWRKEAKAKHHTITWDLIEGAVRRGRGRPSGSGGKKSDEVGWGLKFRLEEIPRQERSYEPEAMFVLLTTVPDRRVISDQRLLETYRGRNVVELCFKWMKGPAAVNPVWLKKASRIQSLGFVLVVWMMVYSLIQREMRQELARRGPEATAPHPDKRWTNRPTTKGVLDIFADIEVVHCSLNGSRKSELRFWDARHQHVMDLLGVPDLYRENLRGPST